MPSGIVFDIRRFSIQDGPGIRTTVFLKGCPLRCAWCHNPESQSTRPERVFRLARCIRCGDCIAACPHGAISEVEGVLITDARLCDLCGACVAACCAEARELIGRQMSVEQVLAEVLRDTLIYDETDGGVTLSGGEPMLQPQFTLELLRACKAQDLRTALDTSGHTPWKLLEQTLPVVDVFLYDIKLMQAARHVQFTGVSNRRILANLQRLSASGASLMIRIPIIPGINDDAENLCETGAFLSGLAGIQRVDVLPYHPSASAKYQRLQRDYSLAELQSPTAEQMEQVASLLRAYSLPVHIGG